MARKAKVFKEAEHKESIMTELNIKTLGELVEKDKKKVGDVKRMIERYGIYYLNRWYEWEAAPKGSSNSDQIINNAISALGEYADIFDERTPIEDVEDFFRNPDQLHIYRYGFNQDKNGNLLVEKTHIQTLEEQIENLKEENKRLGGVYESQTNKKLVAPELELANQLYRDALKKRDAKTNKVEGKTPLSWMQDRLQKIDSKLGDATIKRIASVANWHNKHSNIPNK